MAECKLNYFSATNRVNALYKIVITGTLSLDNILALSPDLFLVPCAYGQLRATRK